MKLIAAVLALSLAPVAAHAQQAAARLPNTLDGQAPAAGQTPATPAPAPAPAARASAASEGLLKAFIASVQADAIDYSTMTEGLATEVRAQAVVVGSLVKGYGAVKAVRWLEAQQGGDVYRVSFEKQETDWFIGVDESGKVAGLLFRPTPEAE